MQRINNPSGMAAGLAFWVAILSIVALVGYGFFRLTVFELGKLAAQ